MTPAPKSKTRHLTPLAATAPAASGLARELAYHLDLAAKLYQSAIRFARRDRDGKAAECLESALEHEAKAETIQDAMARRHIGRLIGLRGGQTWGKEDQRTETLDFTLLPSGDFSISRRIQRDYMKGCKRDEVDDAASAAPLGLSPLTNFTAEIEVTNFQSSALPRARRGTGGTTPYNRKRIRSGCALLEKIYGRKQLALWTCTLPTKSVLHHAVIAAQLGRLIDMLRKRMSRALAAAGLPPHFLVVVELQERGAIHLHCLFVGRHPWSTWSLGIQQLDAIWKGVVETILGAESEGMNFRPSCKIETPRGSVQRELSKYLSKGCGAHIEAMRERLSNICESAGIEFDDLLPTSWVSMDDGLRHKLEEATQRGSIEVPRAELDWIEIDRLVRASGKVMRMPKSVGGNAMLTLHRTAQGVAVCLSGRLIEANLDILLDALSWLGSPQGVSVSKTA